ncbi:MAG: hypothetical protein AMXMBFR78_31140 [Rubrivivax sp.]|jgi:hypothetical protein
MSNLTTYPLRLPKSVKAQAEALSKADGTSLNQFVAIAVAEKIAALKTAAFFEERRRRSTGKALEAALNRSGGEPPREGDELPEGYVPIGGPVATATKTAAKSGRSRAPARKPTRAR